MRKAFDHAGRVLKRGGRAVLAFSNSNDKIWDAVQTALSDAGFETSSVHLLSQGPALNQGSQRPEGPGARDELSI